MKSIIPFLLMLQLFFVATVAADEPEPIALWPDGQALVAVDETEAANAYITLYRPEKPNGTAAVICAGGGYGRVLWQGAEGVRTAKWLNKHGITGIVLRYRLPHGKPYRPLYDAQRAIRMVRSQARELEIDPRRIGIIGFSAGGHLASMAATKFDGGDPDAKDPLNKISSRPDFAILVYPVITMRSGTHAGSKRGLLGTDPSEEMVELFSNELQVTSETPPTFLAHPADDTVVPPSNSKLFYDALVANKVSAKYLELPSGGHGLNGYSGPMWDAWETQSMQWLAAQTEIGVGAKPVEGAEVLFDGSREMLDEKWTYWEGPRYGSSLPIKWKILPDPVDPGTVMMTDDPAAKGGKYGTADVVTKQKFRDFRLHVEFLVPKKRGNSGVYLQNRYEIQILDGDKTKHGMGAVINETPSPYELYNGVGKWNAYDIIFRAARFKDGQRSENAMVSMFFNGKRAHTNQAIHQVWGGENSGIDGGNDGGKGITDTPGGLKLQCEGHEVLYRNIWIKELDLAEPDTDFDQ
jgi:acetyl esterase/lipase